MQICQNPNCSNPFNPDTSKFCLNCGQSNFGTTLRNRYRVLRLIGEGGFSKTYAAEDIDRLDAPCVIKQFFPQVRGTTQLNKAADFFKEEAFRLYELGENHPQIPRLLAYFEQGVSLHLVQEFIIGKTLLQEIQEKAYTETEIIQLLADLLPVLDFIHQRNVIHRDIKLENIIRRDSDGKPVLIDFGGAKQVTQTSLARQATVIYTLGYAPTEQMAGFACQASDLYSLGVTCIRLLTQDLPLQDSYGNLNDYLYDPMNAKWLWNERLQEKGIIISDGLKQILDKLLKHFPSERYQSATEVLEDLHLLQFPGVLKIPSVPQSPPKVIVPLPPLKTFEFYLVIVDTAGREIQRNRRSAKYFAEELHRNTTLEMVSIPGGDYMMGSPAFEGDADERPQHQVTIKPFFMGKFPITQAQWRAVVSLPKIQQNLNPNPSKFKGANLPVENVSWYEAVEFCLRLSAKTGREYRLPSEAEWEYACRAGTTTSFHFGETITRELVNYSGVDSYAVESKRKFRPQTTDVGSFEVANAFGLYDMHGLVWEWCADPWHNNYYDAPTDGSVWEVGGAEYRRVVRGGSWNFGAELCRSPSRSWNESDGGLRMCGFRVVFSTDIEIFCNV
ncbi:bifunctional serine/threonine-protein kinase/formylglycine-generating enzyme family protein [Cronbergia sp. UHCC 0137]|uniref:bifunctional serine/threonine-protein kinase/formylglycine-generating enzyme family protein n=1 Tax=Cronbergia sp. UHCC 0137 TaxID=3110239 RepID=UPI002B1F288C|nr:bifunctional serine/threonine-protein kinase/formylglycine-generating enzyme family protein [Cronbergia sp. UHCC 0137]MEA5618408.1 bifunctional serine/threonine-protein kinase/formylglycine-generating enzyme family protein [Cronbergia sp. UHCC 0137]